MTQQLIVTTPQNSGQGDTPPIAFGKVNANFTDVYGQLGGTVIVSNAFNTNINFAGAQNSAANSWVFQSNVSVTGQVSQPPDGNISPFNLYITDTADTTTIGNGLLSALAIEEVPAAGHTGARNAIFAYMVITATPGAPPVQGYCAVQNRIVSQANLTGTAGTFANYAGGIYAGNSDVQCKSGATFIETVAAQEFNTAVTTGASCAEKLGLSIVETAIDANRGVYDDSALRFANQDTAGTTWKYGVAFGGYARRWPFGADSTLIYAWQRQSGPASNSIALNGIDFRNVTFQAGGFAFISTGISVDPNGCLSVTNQGSAAASISCLGTATHSAFLATGAASSSAYVASFVAGSGAGTSFGVAIEAGTNGSDVSLIIKDQTNTNDYFVVFGDGHFGLGYNGTTFPIGANAAGNVSIAAPSSGVALAVAAVANSQGLTVTQAASSTGYAVQINGASTSGSSLGLFIKAGTTGADEALVIKDQTSTHNFLSIFGDGHFGIGYNGTTYPISTNAAGNITLAVPSSGATLIATGTSAGAAAVRLNTTATTGAQTATFTATNKPGSGTTAPTNWLPINLDGTVYYIPCWT